MSTSQQEKPTFIEADDEHDGEQQQLNDASTVNENIEDQSEYIHAYTHPYYSLTINCLWTGFGNLVIVHSVL